MLRRFISSAYVLAVTTTLTIVSSAAAEEATYKIMYRVGSKAEWREATDAGSPAKSKTVADRIAKQLQDKYRGGLAAVEVDVRLMRTTPSISGTWEAWSGESRLRYEFRTDGTIYLSIKNPYFGQSKSGQWSQDGAAITAKFVDSGVPGTGGFSECRNIAVRIISANSLMIDGDAAVRSP